MNNELAMEEIYYQLRSLHGKIQNLTMSLEDLEVVSEHEDVAEQLRNILFAIESIV